MTIITVVSFLFFTFNSCNKEQVFSGNTEIQSSMSKLTPKERVDYFRAVVDKTQLESRDEGQTYTAEEAVLGVETLLNYDYDDFTKRYNNSDVKKDTITISKNNGVIDDNVIADLNDAVLDIMQCHFANIDSTNKKEMFVDMYNVSENSQEFQVGVTNVVGLFPTINLPDNLSFGPGDNWKANFGKCDGTHPESNAPKRIASYASWNIGINYLEAGVWFDSIEHIWYNDVDALTWFGLNSNDPKPGDYIIDYYEWQIDWCMDIECNNGEIPYYIEDDGEWKINPDFENAYCIEYSEMNYYLLNAEQEAMKYQSILGKKFLVMEMEHDGAICCHHREWMGNGTYAKQNIDYTRTPKIFASCK